MLKTARRIVQWARGLVDRAGALASPGKGAWKGAAIGLFITTLVIVVIDTAQYCVGTAAGIAVALGVPFALLMAAASACVALAVLGLFAAMPSPYRWVFWGSVAILLPAVFIGEFVERLVPVAIVVALASVAGATCRAVVKGELREATRRRSVAVWAGLSLSAAGLVYVTAWYFSDGKPTPMMIDAAKATKAEVAQLELADPGAPGDHAVLRLFYGSGRDLRRDEFGAGATLVTKPVDGSRFLMGWNGWDGSVRTRFWGFDAKSMPLNGRVFYPEGQGPFPVVLVVHGNHIMQEYSDAGYDYLGEHLASRGFVFVSVDENFLNGAPWAKLGTWGLVRGLANENAARGWLLLEHLAALRTFHGEAGNPLHGRLDLDRVALMGHSRGGEAVAAAAMFNRLKHPPDDATIDLDYGFGIRALVAIATTDKQFRPGGVGMPLRDVDFLALQGSNDADVLHFQGMQQYDRVSFTPGTGGFKAAVYIYRANHGQFNRAWGRRDLSQFQKKWLLNTTPLMPAADQEQIAKAYIGGFLEASLHGQRGYLPMLRDHRVASRWLPDTIYVNRYDDARRRVVTDFDDDVDVTTTTAKGGTQAGEHLTVWREQPLGRKDRWPDLENRSAYLGWDRDEHDGDPAYAITLPPGLALAAGDALTFGLADANEGTLPPGTKRKSKKVEAKGPRAPIALSIEVEDAAGHTARIALGDERLVQAQLEATIWKTKLMEERVPESVLQTHDVPLARFVAKNAALDVTTLRKVRFAFDGTAAGVVILDDVGLRTAEATP